MRPRTLRLVVRVTVQRSTSSKCEIYVETKRRRRISGHGCTEPAIASVLHHCGGSIHRRLNVCRRHLRQGIEFETAARLTGIYRA